MQEIILTCPFTGVEFTALTDVTGNLYFNHPLTGKVCRVNYNCSIKKYNLPKEMLKHIETVTLTQTAEILEVSRQRVNTIAQTGIIKPKTVNGQTVFILDEVLDYKRNRKVGAPRKDAECTE